MLKDRNHPSTLSPKQRRFVDQLIERFGERASNVKRAAIRIAAMEILGTAYAPAWIVHNKTLRIEEKRAMYDLTVLLKLPVVEPEESPGKIALRERRKAAMEKKAAKAKANEPENKSTEASGE